MRCTLCPVRELTRETEEIDCGKCDSYTRCCRNLRPPIQWVSQKFCNHSYTGSEILRPFIHWASQKFCKHSYIGCCRNLRPLIHWVWQKFCDLLYNGCRRNSATIHTLGVAEILRPLMHWMQQKFYDHTHTLDVEEIQRSFMIIHKVSQKFCNDSYTGCCRNSATTQTLSLAENLRLFIHWMSQKFCNHSQTGCKRDSEKKYYIDSITHLNQYQNYCLISQKIKKRKLN